MNVLFYFLSSYITVLQSLRVFFSMIRLAHHSPDQRMGKVEGLVPIHQIHWWMSQGRQHTKYLNVFLLFLEWISRRKFFHRIMYSQQMLINHILKHASSKKCNTLSVIWFSSIEVFNKDHSHLESIGQKMVVLWMKSFFNTFNTIWCPYIQMPKTLQDTMLLWK